LLEHYLKRSERFSLLSPEVVDEAKFLLRTLEQGYRLAITRSAVIFDFAQLHSNIENEVGIEFHRVGRTHIEELLSFPVGDENEPTLDTLELTLPRLDSANFMFKQRDRTVSWDQMLLTIPKTPNSEPIAHESGSENKAIYNELRTESKAVSESQISVEQPSYHNPQKQIPEQVALEKSALELARQLEYDSILTTGEDPGLDIGAVADNTPLDNSKVTHGKTSTAVPHDIVLGVNGDSAQFGILGEASGRKVALDLNHTHTISLFGVQGGGKSYTLGSVVEMATAHIPHINQLLKPLSTVIFHYSPTQDYKPEFTSMIAANDDCKQIQMLKEHYGADPLSLSDVVLLTPVDKLEQRKAEYPGIEVYALKFSSAELQAGHWKFLMGAVGNQAAYIRQMTNIMRQNRQGITLEGLKQGVLNSRMSDAMQDLAMMRLDFAEQYIDDSLGVAGLIRPGRMIIVDLRDEFIEKDEALGLFVVLLQIFSEATYQGDAFNKLIVFDECHKYIDNPDLVKGLIEVVP